MNGGALVTVVTGGAGFMGSHLCATLLARGDTVICVDNYCTGDPWKVSHLRGSERFHVVAHDITEPLASNTDFVSALSVAGGVVHRICNLASPASPTAYQRLAVETLMAGSIGVKHLLDLAVAHGAVLLQASTSEVYGDPLVHPQAETYWGNVNPNGPRSMYDESKRFAEALCAAYVDRHGLELRTVRIFNTYGPAMDADDGRVVTNFIAQALRGDPITVYGNGGQTRSFCYIDDMIAGQLALLGSDVRGPVNIGNPDEFTVLQLAEKVIALTGSSSQIVHRGLPGDDPQQRQPDITRARTELGWVPKVDLDDGLRRTIGWFQAATAGGSAPAAASAAPTAVRAAVAR